MFARTARLLLRPGFAEDAPALARAIDDSAIVRNLATAPWPYGPAEAEQFLASAPDPVLPRMLIVERTSGAPRLVGACGLTRRPSGAVELRYWIARTLKLARLEAAHFVDNPASGRVLEKLGFAATGLSAPRHSCARGEEIVSKLYRLALGEREEAIAA